MKKINHTQHSELWLISYADLMTLLFGFFFLLYVSQEEGFQAISDSIQKSLGATTTSEEKTMSEQKKGEIEKARLFLSPCRLCIHWSSANPEGTLTSDYESGATLTVFDVVPGGPAAKAGLQDLDIIVFVNGLEATFKNTRKLLETIEPNGIMTFTVLRNGKRETIPVQLDLLSEEQLADMNKPNETKELLPRVHGHKLTDKDRINFYIPRYVEGDIVTSVDGPSLIKVGDVIVEKRPLGTGNFQLVKVQTDREVLWLKVPLH